MNFEISFDQTDKLVRKNHLSQVFWGSLAIIPLLYISQLGASLIDWFFGSSTPPTGFYQFSNIAIFTLLVLVISTIVNLRTLKRYRHNEPYKVQMRFNTEGFSTETYFETCFTKWIRVIKTKRASTAFVLQIPSGQIYIPIESLSADQMSFIESAVRNVHQAA